MTTYTKLTSAVLEEIEKRSTVKWINGKDPTKICPCSDGDFETKVFLKNTHLVWRVESAPHDHYVLPSVFVDECEQRRPRVFCTRMSDDLLERVEEQSLVLWRSGDKPTQYDPPRYGFSNSFLCFDEALYSGSNLSHVKELSNDEFIDQCAEIAPKPESKACQFLGDLLRAAEVQRGVSDTGEAKPRWELLPYDALGEVAKTMTAGAEKYGDDDWRHGDANDFLSSMMRHVAAGMCGEEYDKDLKERGVEVSPWACVAANALFILALEMEDEDESR